ncbi:MAG: NUDIX domain-containing protein [Cyanobium sp. MAG06]|nr:NUDIX domain-containing protein [Cyanobium sp. MAG06]
MTEFQPQQSGIEKKPKMTKEATVLIERKQKLNPENIDVVRVLLTQPISSTDINDMDTTDLYNISFMRSVLSKKSEGASNPGQLMPVGGNIDDGDYAKANSTNELLLIAAHRELMEETHLKASKMEVLDTIQDYSFMHRAKNQQEGGAKKSEMNRKVKFVSATLLSHRFDRPYPLDIEEDKIKGFRRFDYNQFSKLLKEGTIETDGSNLIILDSLISSAEKRKKLVNGSNTKTRPEIVKKVHKEILQSMEESEFNKKKKILLMLNKLGKIKIPKEKDLLTSINKIQNSAKKLEKINTL